MDEYYTVSVAALSDALTRLQPDDRVMANGIGNLLVLRDGVAVGHINIRQGYEPHPLELYPPDGA